MLTPDEYQALLLILQRAPLNMAEKIAIDAILSKLAPAAPPPDEEQP